MPDELTILGNQVREPVEHVECFPAPRGCTLVRFSTDEVTSLCPVTGQPDISSVEIEYEPDELCVESKSLKLYLWGFRDRQVFAEALAVEIATFPGVVGTAVTKVCSTEVARTGLTEAECKAAGLGYVTTTIESTTRAGYFPGAKPITVKMLAEPGSGRVLGAQIVGEEGAAKRIDVVAVALHAEMTVQDVVDADLGYAPPFSPLWDPVAVAARELLKSC